MRTHFPTPDERSGPAARRLQRNLRRRRLGGVCAGIADFLGVEVKWVRLGALMSIFVSFSLTFWLYLALWVVLPGRPETPMPDVSWALRRELRTLDRMVRRVHRRLPAPLADQAQSAFDALKVLAGELEAGGEPGDKVRSAWAAGRERLPSLLRRMLAAPPGERLLTELAELETTLRKSARAALDRELAGARGTGHAESSAFTTWREHIAGRSDQLRQRVGPQTLAVLQRIEDKLAFLLPRVDAHEGPFDLTPFEVRRIAFTYLPDALDQYLRLPADLARDQPMTDGITAEAALTEQFIRLDHALENLAASVFERDAQGLLIHGRFLRERFAEQPFRLDTKARDSGRTPMEGGWPERADTPNMR
ncbi:MAG TPA: PspC domain-containing protein [Thiobacillaceae bacterium]|nr:PspC domain-containing protein [Thiobacillaceae bacterium]